VRATGSAAEPLAPVQQSLRVGRHE
jgi:hypothetical protein